MSTNINQIIRVLLVEDEDFDVARVKKTVSLSTTRIQVEDVVSNGKSALDKIRDSPDLYDVVILDYQISGGLRGEELIQKMKELDQFLQIVVITKMTINTTDFDFANNLLKAGGVLVLHEVSGQHRRLRISADGFHSQHRQCIREEEA